MKVFLVRCREAWRGPRVVPVQYQSGASPVGLCWRRGPAGDPFSVRIALAAAALLPFQWWQSGLAGFAAVLLSALLTVALTETLFAAARARWVARDWYLTPWLFALAAPAAAGPLEAVFALSLGVLVGRLLFGGAGKQIASPVLLALVMLYAAYPSAFGIGAEPPAWSGSAFTGRDWWTGFAGFEPRIGAGASPLACLAAATYLVVAGVLSWRTLAGGLLGLGLSVLALNALQAPEAQAVAPWYWHAASGGFAFGLVFLAADPGSAPLTPGGRWFLGLATGSLTVLMRTLDPGHPDGVLHAVLMAALFAPLADEWFVWRARTVRRSREEAWP